MVESDNVASYSQSHHSGDHRGRCRDADPSDYSYVPSLIFYFSRGLPEDFVSFIDKTLLRCNCSKLKEFKINWMFMYYEPRFASNLNLWTRFAAMNGTEELHLELDGLTDKLDGLTDKTSAASYDGFLDILVRPHIKSSGGDNIT
ncbi:hypothetical protein U1Q18_019176 [Sarracenia purpurea var. burkii]